MAERKAAPAPAPAITEDARAAARRLGIDLPDACVAGVEANLRLLAVHLQTLRETPP